MSVQSKKLPGTIDTALVIGGGVFVFLAIHQSWDMTQLRSNAAIAAVVLMFAANVPYMLNAVFGEGRPVFVTWMLLGAITLLVVKRQLDDGLSFAVVYPLFAAGAMNLLNCLAGIRKASFKPKIWDVACAIVAVYAIYKWQTTDDALVTNAYLTLASVVAYVPTAINAWSNPEHETFRTYPRNTVRYGLIAVAVQPYTLMSLMYPVTWVLVNGFFTLYLLARRAAVGAA